MKPLRWLLEMALLLALLPYVFVVAACWARDKHDPSWSKD